MWHASLNLVKNILGVSCVGLGVADNHGCGSIAIIITVNIELSRAHDRRAVQLLQRRQRGHQTMPARVTSRIGAETYV